MLEDGSNSDIPENNSELIKEIPLLATDFDRERRELALSYTRASRRFTFQMTGFSFIISILVLLSKVTVYFEQWITSHLSEDPFIIVGVFFIIMFIIITIIELPIGFYSFTHFSRKYGLVHMTNRQWLKRQLKGEFFGFIIGIIVFEGFYLFLRLFPDTWWIWGTVALVFFSIILGSIIPIFIMPRFYRFDPLKETHPELEAEILQMVEENQVKATKVLNWHLGDIASVGNAALIGFGSTRRILIADTMLEKYTTEEIKWILMHEIGHFKNRDLWRQILIGIFTTIFMFFLTHLSFSSLAKLLDYPLIISSVGTLPVLGICFWVINEMLMNIPSLWYSRKRETAADALASSYIKQPAVTKSLFIKMADQNLADIDPPSWEKLLFRSHPTIKERIINAETLSN